MKLIFLLSCLFGVLVINKSARGSSYGPFEFILHHMEECKVKGNGNINFSFKTKKFNRTTYTIDIDAEFKIRLDDSITAQVAAAVLTNGGYKDNFWTRDFPKVCSTGKTFIPKILEGFAAATGHPESTCPFPKGNYTAKNLPISFDFADQVPLFFYNKYRVDIAFTKSRMQGCVSLFVNVVPRTKKG